MYRCAGDRRPAVDGVDDAAHCRELVELKGDRLHVTVEAEPSGLRRVTVDRMLAGHREGLQRGNAAECRIAGRAIYQGRFRSLLRLQHLIGFVPALIGDLHVADDIDVRGELHANGSLSGQTQRHRGDMAVEFDLHRAAGVLKAMRGRSIAHGPDRRRRSDFDVRKLIDAVWQRIESRRRRERRISGDDHAKTVHRISPGVEQTNANRTFAISAGGGDEDRSVVLGQRIERRG